MLNIKLISKIYKAFPNSFVSDPISSGSYILDSKKAVLGHFDHGADLVYLNQGYEYMEQAQAVLLENNMKFRVKEYNKSELLYGENE